MRGTNVLNFECTTNSVFILVSDRTCSVCVCVVCRVCVCVCVCVRVCVCVSYENFSKTLFSESYMLQLLGGGCGSYTQFDWILIFGVVSSFNPAGHVWLLLVMLCVCDCVWAGRIYQLTSIEYQPFL